MLPAAIIFRMRLGGTPRLAVLRALVPLSVVVLTAGCGDTSGPAPHVPGGSDGPVAAGSAGTPGDSDTETAPSWSKSGEPEATVSFEDGQALAAASGVTFSNGLGDVWDWELVGDPASTTTGPSPSTTIELTNTGNGCHVLDERAPFEGVGTDDRAASTALVEARLADAEVVSGPGPDVAGLGEKPGEGGATYEVARAVGRAADQRWLLVTARAFTALAAQQVVTVSCEEGGAVDLTLSQLSQVSFANLRGLEQYP